MRGPARVDLVGAGGGDIERPGEAVRAGAGGVGLVVRGVVAGDGGRGGPSAGSNSGGVVGDDGRGRLAVGGVEDADASPLRERRLITPAYFSEELAQKIPGAKLVMLPQGGHCASETALEVFTHAVLAFLS